MISRRSKQGTTPVALQFPGSRGREFAEVYWDRRPYHASQAVTSDALGLTEDALYQCFIERCPTEPAFACYQPECEDLDEARQILLKLWGDGRPPSLEALRQFNEGNALLVVGAHRVLPVLAGLLGDVSTFFHCRLGCNLYLTRPASRVFAAHIDAHHVLAVQLYGAKEWLLWPPEKPRAPAGPCPGGADPPGEPLRWITVAGDLLYIPVGWVHRAKAAAQVSVHATVSVTPLRWHDWLRDRLGADGWLQLIQQGDFSQGELALLDSEVPMRFCPAEGIYFHPDPTSAEPIAGLVARRLYGRGEQIFRT